MKRVLTFGIFLTLMGFVCQAQEVHFSAQAENVVAVGERFRLVFTLKASGIKGIGNFKAPSIQGFNVLSGPNQSQSQSIQWVNGQMSQSITYRYTYILAATQIGTFQLPSAEIVVDGKNYKSNALSIEVVKGNKPAANNANNSNSNSSLGSDKDLFLRVSFNKSTAFVGEPIVATIKVYASPKINLRAISSMTPPEFNGFWKQE